MQAGNADKKVCISQWFWHYSDWHNFCIYQHQLGFCWLVTNDDFPHGTHTHTEPETASHKMLIVANKKCGTCFTSFFGVAWLLYFCVGLVDVVWLLFCHLSRTRFRWPGICRFMPFPCHDTSTTSSMFHNNPSVGMPSRRVSCRIDGLPTLTVAHKTPRC